MHLLEGTWGKRIWTWTGIGCLHDGKLVQVTTLLWLWHVASIYVGSPTLFFFFGLACGLWENYPNDSRCRGVQNGCTLFCNKPAAIDAIPTEWDDGSVIEGCLGARSGNWKDWKNCINWCDFLCPKFWEKEYSRVHTKVLAVRKKIAKIDMWKVRIDDRTLPAQW